MIFISPCRVHVWLPPLWSVYLPCVEKQQEDYNINMKPGAVSGPQHTHTAHTQNPAGQEWGRLSTGTVELISSWLNHLFVSPVLFSGKISLSSMATSYLVTGEHSVLIEIL